MLQKAAPRPRAGRAAAGPKFTQAGGDEFVPGVLGGLDTTGTGGISNFINGNGGTVGLSHFGQSAPLTRTSSTGKIEQYSGVGTYKNYLMQVGDGSAIQHVTNSSNPQQLTYGGQVAFLRKKDGAAVYPRDPTIIQAAAEGNSAPLKEWAKKERAKDPTLTFGYYQSATPSKNADLTVGSEDELYEELRAARDKATEKGGNTADMSDKDKALMSKMQALIPSATGRTPITDGQLKAVARKMHGEQSAIMYIPYEGASKILVDAHTGYALRDKNRMKQRQTYLDNLEKETRPGTEEQRGASLGRGPLAGALTPAPAPATRTAPKAAPASANPYKFNFKKM